MADTSQQTLQKMKDMRKELDKHDPIIKKAYESVTKELRSAIDDESEDEIKISQPKLDPAIEKIDQGLDACDRLHVLTTALLADKAFVATRIEEIKELIKHVAVTKNRLSTWATAARKLGEEADKALGGAQKSSKEVEAELGGLKNRAKKLTLAVNDFKADAPTLEKAAREATKKGDEKSAERARLTIFDLLKEPKRLSGEMRPLLEKFRKDHPDLDRGMKAELQWASDAFDDAIDTVKDGDKTFIELIKLKQTTMAAAKPAEVPDVPKAELLKVAPIVGIDVKDAKHLTMLAKVLNTMPHEKWADGLAKLATSLKLKNTNGKAMVVAIDKLPYFKKMLNLIDI